MHTATFPTCYQKLSSVKFWLACFFPVLLLSAFLCCLVRIISAGRKRSNVVMWVECHGVFVRQLRFHHVSLRGVIHTYVHTRNQYQYPLNLTVVYFEPPISSLEVRSADATFTLEPLACSAIERWQMEISVWRRYSDIISARNGSLQKHCVVLGYWDNRKSEASSRK